MRLPAWSLWVGGLLVAAIYAAVFYHFFVDPYTFRWQAIYGDATYPDGYSIQGIDISHHQGHIDWDLLRNAQINHNPVRFVIIKATEGRSHLDENFNDNFYEARENGFIRGAYHFFSPSVPAREQAEYFARKSAASLQQLRENTRMWKILLNALPIIVFAKDPQDDFRYVFANKARGDSQIRTSWGLPTSTFSPKNSPANTAAKTSKIWRPPTREWNSA